MSRFSKPYIYWNQAVRRWVFAVAYEGVNIPCATFREAISALDAYLAQRVQP